jgi:hypothetical protein
MNSNSFFKKFYDHYAIFALAVLLVLLVNGALPFFAMPTMGQAIWLTGFSQSFANESFLSIYAQNIGAPKPAAMAFGLAGGWVAGVFIRFGLHASDAYALTIALWLVIAFWGSYKLCRSMEVSPRSSILAALVWGTMPMVWNHAGYSMLSTGIALLPFYFWATLNFFESKEDPNNNKSNPSTRFVLYLVACVISIFMDGYSFMMFAVGANIIGIVLILKKLIAIRLFLIHCIFFGFAYILFATYIQKSEFSPSDLNFFRGWGADISFFIIPSAGVHWIPDVSGWSKARSTIEYFGDESVWVTTFCLPLLLGAIVVSVFAKSKCKITFFVIAAFGFYMSLGPSFKYFSTKPDPKVADVMESKYALAPTGTGFFSEKLPGFKNMRASYRWAALGCFGAWALMVLGLSRRQPRSVILIATGALVLVAGVNFPNLPKQLERYKSYRNQFLGVDIDLLMGMRDVLKPGDKVVFLPWGNDFLVNYLASKLDVISYNIGGNKNYEEARKNWPATLAAIPMETVQDDLASQALSLLVRGDADAVVFPYINMLWAAHQWPYPVEYKESIESKLLELRSSHYFEVVSQEYYSVARLKQEFSSKIKRKEVFSEISSLYCIPLVCLNDTGFTGKIFSQTGVVSHGKLVTSGEAGFLHFGPYKNMNSGLYNLTVRGSVENASAAWVDVVSQRGNVNHGKFLIEKSQNATDRILISAPISLQEDAHDIEVRIYVGTGDQLAISSYEMRSQKAN